MQVDLHGSIIRESREQIRLSVSMILSSSGPQETTAV